MSSTEINITSPSEAYKQATGSLVYRISELMFGSLLAAYSLGFVAAIATRWTVSGCCGWRGIVLLIVQYASISLAFAYVTTSLYLTYQTGILTMPQLRLDRLAIDFSLAIIQALFFGFSVLWPWSFPILLGITLGLAGYRQSREHRRLAEKLYEVICKPGVRINNQHCEKFRYKLAKLVRDDFPQLSGWAPTGFLFWVSAVTMLVIGGAIGYLVLEPLPATWLFRNLWSLRTDPVKRELLITIEVAVIFVVIAFYSHRVLKQRATFFQPLTDGPDDATDSVPIGGTDHERRESNATEVDLEFRNLRGELEKICAQRLHPDAGTH